MKNHQDIAKILDEALDEAQQEEYDGEKLGHIEKLTGRRIALARETVKYKKLTSSPKSLEFFQDH